MIIEVAKEGRMDLTGSSVRRVIQNNSMPDLDLLVRESIQNSLDAFRKDTKAVRVDLGVGVFNNQKLAKELDGITGSLLSRYESNYYKHLYIRDRGTVGLTGPLHFSDRRQYDNNNLLKLVYDVGRPQEEKGAGGSWGYGKTVYYRIGIGLVIYYSRIKDKDGTYKSRLAACLVEDESSCNALLSNPSLNSKRGLAWWGRRYSYRNGGIIEEGTIPETDERYINNFLSIFSVEPYREDETGTTIIIPYISEKRLLTNTKVADSKTLVPWTDSVKDYLKIACQRWYVGRINNIEYQKYNKQPLLQISVNGEVIRDDDIARPFKEIRKLYNMALTGKESNSDYYCEPIKLRNLFTSTTVGFVAYKMYTKAEMEMNPPINNPSPFVYVKNEDNDDYKDGDIILTFFRKPGMAVTYDTAGEWVNKIKSNNEKSGEYLLIVFVLKSDNTFSNNGIKSIDTIEEYFRSSERADHTAWYDINIDGYNPKILQKIQLGIRKKVNETFKTQEQIEERRSSSLSNMFGEYFLPPEGFGKKASLSGKGSKETGGIQIRHKNVRASVNRKKIVLNEGFIRMPLTVEAVAPISEAHYSLEIAADGKNIPLIHWKDKTGLDVPFSIENFTINRIQTDKKTIGENILLDKKREKYSNNSCSVSLEKSTSGDLCGIRFSSDYKDVLISGEVKVRVNDVMAQMSYSLKEGE